MKIIYFVLLGGMSGDMTLAAFLDAGLSFGYLKKELAKLNIKGFELSKSLVERRHARAMKFTVTENDKRSRSLNQILRIIEQSGLKREVKNTAKAIYNTLALAESHAHHEQNKSQHFDELGRIDSIVDIVGAAVALDYFSADKYYVSDIPVSSQVGPATLELLKGFKIQAVNYDYETVTPTGAAILKTLKAVSISKKIPVFSLEKTGFGAGSFNPTGMSNVLKIIFGSIAEALEEDKITVVECNIDDMSPQNFEYLEEELFKSGALDVYIRVVQMKKSRPGFLLTVLTAPPLLDKVIGIIFKETSTFGVRYYPADRKKLKRELKITKSKIGSCRVKLGSLNSTIRNISPEYEDCKRLARTTGKALREVYDTIKIEGIKKWRSQG